MRETVSVIIKVINVLISIVQIIIGLGIVLKLFNANLVPFVKWVYGLETPLIAPFKGIFNPAELAPHYLLDLSAVFALIVYSVIGYTLIKLIVIFTSK